MSDRLTDRLLDAQGRPSRAARRSLAATVVAVFVVAFLLGMDSPARDTGPHAAREEPSAARVPTGAGLAKVAALPALHRDPRPRPAPKPPVAPAAATPRPVIAARPTPVATSALPEPPAPTPTRPAPSPVSTLAPTPAPTAVPPPEQSFDSYGGFDSSG